MVDSADKRGANLWTVGCAITIQALVFYLFTFKLNEVDFIRPKPVLLNLVWLDLIKETQRPFLLEK